MTPFVLGRITRGTSDLKPPSVVLFTSVDVKRRTETLSCSIWDLSPSGLLVFQRPSYPSVRQVVYDHLETNGQISKVLEGDVFQEQGVHRERVVRQVLVTPPTKVEVSSEGVEVAQGQRVEPFLLQSSTSPTDPIPRL